MTARELADERMAARTLYGRRSGTVEVISLFEATVARLLEPSRYRPSASRCCGDAADCGERCGRA